ncbi:MAG: hypothetical protein IJH64_05340 [Oscillospiraceae bacterium]|nr:hypothetical protein [Oscillospiraceae bacterium]
MIEYIDGYSAEDFLRQSVIVGSRQPRELDASGRQSMPEIWQSLQDRAALALSE